MSDSHTSPPAHLAAERLAALADEAPTAEEAAHLSTCLACRHEQEAYVALLDLARAEGASAPSGLLYAAESADVAAPAAWDALAATLRAEGLVRPATEVAAADRAERAWARPVAERDTRRRAVGSPGAARLAASVALAVGAAVAGRWSAGHGPWAVAAVAPNVRPADTAFASAETARAALARARADYARAAAFLGEADPAGDLTASDASTGTGTGMPARDSRDAELLRARLAALDAMLPRVRAAASEAPQDPAVNHVYLTAYDAREAALRQLGRTLPAGVRLAGY